jgi:tRNA(His) guanylyltransferase
MTPTLAHQRLKGTFSKEKNEILFTQFGINYNDEPEVYKRGTILIRVSGDPTDLKEQKKQAKAAKQAKSRDFKPEDKLSE